MPGRLSAVMFWSLIWVALVGLTVFVRPPLPVDETRYLAVAWEMWLRGDYLVPHLNGGTYSHKPPLLFWLMNLTWAIFGVNDWAPRLVAPLFGLGCLFLTRAIARDLWPAERRVHDLAPLLLLCCVFWVLFTTLTMFDLMLAFCALLGIKGVLMAWRRGGIGGFLLTGVAIGLGALTKGPAILLHILPVALLAPFWAGRLAGGPALPLHGWGRWYLGVLASVVLGVVIGLVWAVPAGIAGGEEYRNAIFWGQTAGRMVKSFAHQRPFWWYAAVLPGLMLPLLLWPGFWRGLRSVKGMWSTDGGCRMCVIWALFAFGVFSLVSGKQLHYLLPEFPALTLIVAVGLGRLAEAPERSIWRMAPGVLMILLGLVIFAAPFVEASSRQPDWLGFVRPLWGAPVIAVGAWLMYAAPETPAGYVRNLALSLFVFVGALHLAAAPALDARYDLRPVARQLKEWERAGIPLANFGKYHGQYQFLGRLEKPMAIMGQREGDEAAFLDNNPTGYVVAYYKNVPTRADPVKTYRFRRITIAVWDAPTMLAHPNIGDRR